MFQARISYEKRVCILADNVFILGSVLEHVWHFRLLYKGGIGFVVATSV